MRAPASGRGGEDRARQRYDRRPDRGASEAHDGRDRQAAPQARNGKLDPADFERTVTTLLARAATSRSSPRSRRAPDPRRDRRRAEVGAASFANPAAAHSSAAAVLPISTRTSELEETTPSSRRSAHDHSHPRRHRREPRPFAPRRCPDRGRQDRSHRRQVSKRRPAPR